MSQETCRQFAFSVDIEERAVFNQAVEANGATAAREIRRMVDDFLLDQSQFSEMMKSSRMNRIQTFPTKEVKINAHFNDVALRRFTVICQYANVTVAHMLREMIVAYAQEHACAAA